MEINMLVIPLTFLFTIFLVVNARQEVSPELSKVFGPGLEVDMVLPVRYIIIQAVDTDGTNFTQSPGQYTFKVEISSAGFDRLRVMKEVLDRNDGTFLVRLRYFQTYEDVKISVLFQGSHVAKSPYILKGAVYSENCNCPEDDAELWKENMHCGEIPKQIIDDLKLFPKIDLVEVNKDAHNRFGRNTAVCHYSVINNEIYKKCYGQYVDFSSFMDEWLLSIARKVKLPDLEFFINLGDWPLIKRNLKDNSNFIFPLLSWCGSDETHDIVMPTYDLTYSTLETLGRVSLDMMSVQGNTGPLWDHKIEKGFFRGRDSRRERLELATLGLKRKDLMDVGMTNFFFFEHDEAKHGPKHKHISFFDFFKYKYQLNLDGTVAAYRFPYLLIGDSVVLKQDSGYYEHYYHELKPMVHYIPFKSDISDVEEKLKWAKANDEEAKKIGRNGQQYARDHLLPDKLYCYSFQLFQELATRYIQKPEVHSEQEHIKMPEDQNVHKQCECKRKRKVKKGKKTKKSEKKTKASKTHEEL